MLMFVFVSITFPKQFTCHNTYKIHSLHLQTNEPFLNTFPSRSLLCVFHQFIDIVRTYSTINTNKSYLCIHMCVCVCDMGTRIFKHTHVSIYHIIIIKLYCRRDREFIDILQLNVLTGFTF